MVSVPDNLTTTPSATPTSVTAPGQHPMMQASSPPTSASRADDEELGETSCSTRRSLPRGSLSNTEYIWSPCQLSGRPPSLITGYFQGKCYSLQMRQKTAAMETKQAPPMLGP